MCLRCLLPMIGVLCWAVNPIRAETLVESSAETRFQLDLHVPDATLNALLPPGWRLSVATQGPAKGANLRVIFVDRLTINGPDGKPAGKTGSNRLVYLAAPAKDPAGKSAQLVIGGLTEDPADAPGPFSVYQPAATHRMERSVASGAVGLVETQDWEFTSATGEHLAMHIKFVRGSGTRRPASDTLFYSAKDPALVQISRQEQVLEILRNVTTNPSDRVTEFSFKGAGGSYAKLFDGTESVLSWDNIVWINRSVLAP